MVIAMRTIFIAIFVDGHILPKGFFALFADEGHLGGLCQGMCLRFRMAL